MHSIIMFHLTIDQGMISHRCMLLAIVRFQKLSLLVVDSRAEVKSSKMCFLWVNSVSEVLWSLSKC